MSLPTGRQRLGDSSRYDHSGIFFTKIFFSPSRPGRKRFPFYAGTGIKTELFLARKGARGSDAAENGIVINKVARRADRATSLRRP